MLCQTATNIVCAPLSSHRYGARQLFQPEGISETYTFYTLTDDGTGLWVDNRLVIND